MYAAPVSFTTETEKIGTTTIVTIRGEIDIATVGTVAACVVEVLRDLPETLVVDLHRTDFIETAGARMLLHAEKRAVAANVRFIVVIGDTVPRVLELAELDGELRTPMATAVPVTG